MSENFESTYESSIPNQDFWENDGTSLTGNPFSTDQDSIVFTNTRVRGGFGDDHLTFNPPLNYSSFNIKMPEDTNKNGFWKYNEDKTLKAIEDYLASTYHSHYTSDQSKTQTLDLIESIGDAEPFTRSNAIKYLSRFGKKNGKSKMDILKAIHYCILLYHFAGLHKNTTNTYNY